jgi:hypothetical protein
MGLTLDREGPVHMDLLRRTVQVGLEANVT